MKTNKNLSLQQRIINGLIRLFESTEKVSDLEIETEKIIDTLLRDPETEIHCAFINKQFMLINEKAHYTIRIMQSSSIIRTRNTVKTFDLKFRIAFVQRMVDKISIEDSTRMENRINIEDDKILDNVKEASEKLKQFEDNRLKHQGIDSVAELTNLWKAEVKKSFEEDVKEIIDKEYFSPEHISTAQVVHH